MNCGLSSKLVGTGFAVHRSVLEQSGGWNSATIAEDAEFAAYLAETGTRVWFVPEAVTYDEAPTSVRVSLRQRRRWSSGIMDVAQARAGALARSAFAGGGMRALDMLAMLTQPFCQAAGFLLTCAFALSQTGWKRALAASAAGASGRLSCHERVCTAAGGNLEAEDRAARRAPVPAVYGKLAAAESGVAAVQNPGLEGN